MKIRKETIAQLSLVAPAGVFLVACSGINRHAIPQMITDDVIQLSNEYVAERYSGYSPTHPEIAIYIPEIAAWSIQYSKRQSNYMSDFTVFIDDRNGTVRHAFRDSFSQDSRTTRGMERREAAPPKQSP